MAYSHLRRQTAKPSPPSPSGAGVEVPDFDAHLQYMEGFHRRYMASTRAMTLWAQMARQLDIEMIAPQHGAMFRGRDMVKRFIDWADGFVCGIDLMEDTYALPS